MKKTKEFNPALDTDQRDGSDRFKLRTESPVNWEGTVSLDTNRALQQQGQTLS